MRGRLAVLAVIVVVDIALVRAHHGQPKVNVVTVTPQAVGPHVASSRGGGSAAPIASGTGAAGPVTDGSCPSTAPDPTWTCKQGTWLPPSGVGMGAPHLGSCAGASPSPSFVCQNGMWTLPASGSSNVGANPAGATNAANATTSSPNGDANGAAPASTSTTTGDLNTTSPPAAAPGTPGMNPSTQSPQSSQLPGSSGSGCSGQPPSVAWTCRNGVWIPGLGGGGL